MAAHSKWLQMQWTVFKLTPARASLALHLRFTCAAPCLTCAAAPATHSCPSNSKRRCSEFDRSKTTGIMPYIDTYNGFFWTHLSCSPSRIHRPVRLMIPSSMGPCKQAGDYWVNVSRRSWFQKRLRLREPRELEGAVEGMLLLACTSTETMTDCFIGRPVCDGRANNEPSIRRPPCLQGEGAGGVFV